MQRGVYHSLLTVLCALALSGGLMRGVAAQARANSISDAVLIDDAVINDAASCAQVHGTWRAADARCSLEALRVRATSLTIAPTITLAISRTFSNGGLDFAVIRPDIVIVSFLTGTTEISGTLVIQERGDNYDRLLNHGVVQVDGDFTNRYATASVCDQSLPEPEQCRITPHLADLRNDGRMHVVGRFCNQADFRNTGELVVAADVTGTTSLRPNRMDAALLAAIKLDMTDAHMVNERVMTNTGVVENFGTVYVASTTAEEGGRASRGEFVNTGRVDNYAALGFAEDTYLDNRGVISNTGVLVLAGNTLNAGRIVGDGALVNRGEFINVGRLDGLIYNEGRILNAGMIDGSVLGPGELIELDERQYLPLAVMPGGS